MKAAKWPVAGRSERVATARAAFDVAPPDWHVRVMNIRNIAEDVDLEYK